MLISKAKQTLKFIRVKILVLNAPFELMDLPSRKDIMITQVTFDNLTAITDFRSKDILPTFRDFLEEGDIGVYAYRNSKVVGHLWGKVCRQESCRVHGYFDIARDEALILYGNVSEDCRGLRIFESMMITLCHLLFSKAKVSRILADPWVDNVPSWKGILKVGFKQDGVGTYIQFGHILVFRHISKMDKCSNK